MISYIEILFFAFLGGLIPAVFWLAFWLREDKAKPEPRYRILLTFIAGMIAVPLVLPFEKEFYNFFSSTSVLNFFALSSAPPLVLFAVWSTLEETFKFIAAWLAGLRSKENDEPIDSVIYMIIAAIGFTAMENTFFIINPLSAGNILESIVTGNLRFVGASLLHIIASATIGIFIAFAFNKSRKAKVLSAFVGLLCAIVLHTTFNVLIMNSNGVSFLTFFAVWCAAIVLLVFFEKIKTIQPKTI